MTIEERLLKGDKKACARLISMLENNEEEAIGIIKKLFHKTGNAYVIGITGPPGSGKSTLTDRLTKALLAEGKKVGILAVDPTSPFSGGAILGDRIRMGDLALDKNVFIRSMGTRGYLGGISKATWGAVKVLDIYGCDYIFIETVGVGQSEVDIVKMADTVLMVLVPNMGDDIQAIKAGIMEIADVFAINKSDLDGADKTKMEIEMNLDLNEKKDYRPPVVQVSALKSNEIDVLMDKLKLHEEYLKNTGQLHDIRRRNLKVEILQLVEEDILKLIMDKAHKDDLLDELSAKVENRVENPYTAKEKIVSIIKGYIPREDVDGY